MFTHTKLLYKSKKYNYTIFIVYEPKHPYYEITNYKKNKIIDKISYRYIQANKIDIKKYVIEELKK